MIKKFSKRGVYHIQLNEENQDAICFSQNKERMVISLADGVSSCKEAKAGAEIASRVITEILLRKGEFFLDYDEEQIADVFISHIIYELKQQAMVTNQDVREFSSTISSVFLDKKQGRMLSFNLGDSIIMASKEGQYRLLAKPADTSSGYCVTTTTSNAIKMATIKKCNITDIASVVICSDGAWKKFFEQNRVKPEVAMMLNNSEYDKLESYLMEQECSDDCSFVSLII